MNGLPMPGVDSHTHFLVIARSKNNCRQRRLLALADRIKDRYGDFDDHKLDLTSIPYAVFAPTEADDLADCYTNGTRALDDLRQLLRSNLPVHRQATCSYCGIGAPSTMDHYLPKSAFPEFAVMALNLLPCCYECNTKKGNVFVEGGKRTIFYLYGDTIPDQRYLFAEIEYIGATPVASFRLQPHQGIDASVFNRIQSHYARLNLIQRYNEMASDHISEAMSSARTHCGNPKSPDKISGFLAKERGRLAADKGTNYWKAVLFEALASSPPFVNQCCTVQPF